MDFISITINFCIVLLSLFGNSLVIINVNKFEWLKTPSNYLVVLLAFFDFCNGLPVFVASSVILFYAGQSVNVTTGYEISCYIYVFIIGFSGFGNLLCIIMITLDRYLFIIWPLRYHNLVTYRRVGMGSVLYLILVTLVSAFVFIPPVMKPCNSIVMLDRYIMTYVLTQVLFLAFGLVIVLYGKIAHLTYKARYSNVAPMETSYQSGSQKKTTKVISLVIGVFMISYITYFAAFLVTKDRIGQLAVRVQTVAIWIWKVSKLMYMHIISMRAYFKYNLLDQVQIGCITVISYFNP